MKFLIDESVEFRIVEALRRSSFDVTAIAETSPSTSDLQVLNTAYQQKRILITNDLGFGVLVFKEELSAYGVILLRMPESQVEDKISRLEKVLTTKTSILSKAFTTVTEKRIRPKLLPIAGR